MQVKNSNPLLKQSKLKRFGDFVAQNMRQKIDVEGMSSIDVEMSRIDCLNNDDIYTRRDMWEKLDAIAQCSSILEVRKYNTGELMIHNANYCHNPVVCPICADRVSKRRRAIYSIPIQRATRCYGVSPICGDWKAEYPRKYTGIYFITATIQDCKKLIDGINTLVDSLKNMRKMGQKRKHGRSSGEYSKIVAALQNIEIKKGSGSGLWHVHAHLLVFVNEPIDYNVKDSPYFIVVDKKVTQISKWNYEWYKSTGCNGINFDLEPIEYKSEVNGMKCDTLEESVSAQAQEVLKYTVQLSERKGINLLSPSEYVELIQRRGNRRLFNAIGLFRCDKRNPDSFMTVDERELRRLEYVETMDRKHYEVFSSLWQHGGTYSKMEHQDGAIFSNSDDINTLFVNVRRRAFQAQTAIMQGVYRTERHALFKTRYMHNDKNAFEKLLDDCRDQFRIAVADLWSHFPEENFLPYYLTDFNSTGMQGLRKRYNLSEPVKTTPPGSSPGCFDLVPIAGTRTGSAIDF
jgi:plasmid rolling circle replication initiator protein Rep